MTLDFFPKLAAAERNRGSTGRPSQIFFPAGPRPQQDVVIVQQQVASRGEATVDINHARNEPRR